MKIGTDADGVLIDTTAFYNLYGRRWFGRPPSNPGGYDLKEMFGVGSREEMRFGLVYYFRVYCRKWPPRKGTAAVNTRLNEDGHEIYVVTARKLAVSGGPAGAFVRRLFRQWTRRFSLRFRDVIFCDEHDIVREKAAACARLGLELFIEDNPQVALALAQTGIPVLLFDTPYNQEAVHENIFRVSSWEGVYKWIENYREKQSS